MRRDLEKEGFTFIAESALGFSVIAPPEAYEEITGGKVTAKERLAHVQGGQRTYVTHLDIEGPRQPSTLGVGTEVVVSLGHTEATFDQFVAGIDAGARLVTHLYNTMRGFQHREPGSVGAALTDDRVTVGLIADVELRRGGAAAAQHTRLYSHVRGVDGARGLRPL